MHKDDATMLKYIKNRLNIGTVYIREHFASFSVINKSDMLKICRIFDISPLNTTKHLNYVMFKKAYELYFNTNSSASQGKDKNVITEEILSLKNQMNKKRTHFNQQEGHRINITPYWFLGFIEAEGYFSVATAINKGVAFGLGQTASEFKVLEAIKDFLLALPGNYNISRIDTNPVCISCDSKAKYVNSKPMVKIKIVKADFNTNILIPFLDSLVWLSKKELDYKDWKIILDIRKKGKHFTEQGKKLISCISNRMNRNRLSTNLRKQDEISIDERIYKLLASPSNYEIQPDGKILIKSSGVYLKGRGNIGVNIFDVTEGTLVKSFNSIKECALFFWVSDRTIIRRLDKWSVVEHNNQNIIFKRKVSLP